MIPAEWRAFAKRCAQDAHSNHFNSWWGVWYYEDLDVLVYYDNHPFAHDPTLRDRNLADFRRQLVVEGIEELACETTDDGYSLALVIDAPQFRLSWVRERMTEIVRSAIK